MVECAKRPKQLHIIRERELTRQEQNQCGQK